MKSDFLSHGEALTLKNRPGFAFVLSAEEARWYLEQDIFPAEKIERMPIFSRSIKIEMDWLDDSSFEVKGTLDDNVHSVNARLQVSFPGYEITAAEGDITRMPYPGFCQGAYGVLPQLIGLCIGRGFRQKASEILGGAASCNHLHTLINDMATAAFQMNYYAAKRTAAPAWEELMRDDAKRRMVILNWMPQLRDTCYVFSKAADKVFESESNESDSKV
jgi:hypothetical protein